MCIIAPFVFLLINRYCGRHSHLEIASEKFQQFYFSINNTRLKTYPIILWILSYHLYHINYMISIAPIGSRRWNWKFREKHFWNPNPELMLHSSYSFWKNTFYIFHNFFMVAYLLSPDRCHWWIAKVKKYNLNVTEFRDSDFKNAFPGIFNFTVGILVQAWIWRKKSLSRSQ